MHINNEERKPHEQTTNHKLETEYVDLDDEFSSLVEDLENCKEQL